MTGKAIPVWMSNNVLLEEDAIGTYSQQVEAISAPDIRRLLKRILSDEQAHHAKFAYFVEKTRREKIKDIRGKKNDKVARFLNWGIEHEYTVIL